VVLLAVGVGTAIARAGKTEHHRATSATTLPLTTSPPPGTGGGLGTGGAGQVATGGQAARTGGATLLLPGLALLGAGGGLRRLTRRARR